MFVLLDFVFKNNYYKFEEEEKQKLQKNLKLMSYIKYLAQYAKKFTQDREDNTSIQEYRNKKEASGPKI